MSNRIIIDQDASNTAKLVAEATNAMLVALAKMRRARGIINAASSGDTWPALAVELGLVGTNAATDAQTLWTIFSTAGDRIDHAAVLELSRIDQG